MDKTASMFTPFPTGASNVYQSTSNLLSGTNSMSSYTSTNYPTSNPYNNQMNPMNPMSHTPNQQASSSSLHHNMPPMIQPPIQPPQHQQQHNQLPQQQQPQTPLYNANYYHHSAHNPFGSFDFNLTQNSTTAQQFSNTNTNVNSDVGSSKKQSKKSSSTSSKSKKQQPSSTQQQQQPIGKNPALNPQSYPQNPATFAPNFTDFASSFSNFFSSSGGNIPPPTSHHQLHQQQQQQQTPVAPQVDYYQHHNHQAVGANKMPPFDYTAWSGMAAVSKNVAEQLAKSAKSSTNSTPSTSQPSIYSAQYNVAAVSKTEAASTAGNHSSRLYQHQQQQQQFHSTFNDLYSKSNGNYRLYTNFQEFN